MAGDKGIDGNPNDLELKEGWDKRTMMFVGDGLTMARMKSFGKLLNINCVVYAARRYEKAMMLRKTMRRVVVATGYLHGCRFHVLMSVYSLFYGSLIQPIQTVLLKRKQIKGGSDITAC